MGTIVGPEPYIALYQTHLERSVFTCANQESRIGRPRKSVDCANVPTKCRHKLARAAFP